MFEKFRTKVEERLKSKEKVAVARQGPSFRIKKVRKAQAGFGKSGEEKMANLRRVREEVFGWKFEDERQKLVRDFLVKFHFQSLSEKEKLKIHENGKHSENTRKPATLSEETFSRLKFKKLVIVFNSVQTASIQPNKDASFALNKNVISDKDAKNVLVIEFEGVLGFVRVSNKGAVEFVFLKHLKSLFKKLKKQFHLVVVFRRRHALEFFRKMMEFVKKFDHLVKVFAVVRNPFEKQAQAERSKVKLGNYSKFGTKDARRRTTANAKKTFTGELIIDVREIEKLFPVHKKLLFVSSLKKDLNSHSKSGSIWRKSLLT